MTTKNKKTIFNCHTHIFTIDHVPNFFGKKLLPLFYQLITIKLIKWLYLNLNKRNKRYKLFLHRKNKIKYFILDVLRFTIIGYWIYTLLLFIIKWFFKIIVNAFAIDSFFGPQSKAAYRRYMALCRYATYSKLGQSKVFDLLKKTYDKNTKFVVLPMDMDYMEAGEPMANYMQQLDELIKVTKNNKSSLLPFLFLDSRRISETSNLEGVNCYENYVKRNLSKQLFYGIKMYPALGYYPFDKNLIETYKFAQEHQIPIITHCIEGTVFFRGKKKNEWQNHPILKYKKYKNQEPIPIPLPQKKNYNFTTNFTHPLNYHCLLNKKLLSEFLGEETDLSKLKICLAHFGGTKEWNKYTEDNWNNYNNNISHLSKNEYLNRKIKNTLNHGSSRTIWWNASWLSIIYDLMIQYEGIYSDLSFVVFNQDLFPLLKFLLQDDKVNHKILFGTDYYVVAQKNTEKALFQNLRSYLGEELFYKIANTNPKKFLSTSFNSY